MKRWIALILAVVVYCFSPVASHAQTWGITAQSYGDAADAANKYLKIGVTSSYSISHYDGFGDPPPSALYGQVTGSVFVVWNDVGGGGDKVNNFGNGQFTRDSAYDNGDQAGYSIKDFDLTSFVTFSDAAKLTIALYDNVDSTETDVHFNNPLHVEGTTVVEVAQTADGKTFKPCPGAVVVFGSLSLAVKQPVAGGATYLVFGKDDVNNTPVDSPYPDGMASAQYDLSASWQGQGAAVQRDVGTNYPTKDVLLLMSTPGSNYSPVSGTYPTGQLPTGTKAGSTAAPTGTTTGTGGSIFDADGFIKKLQDLFVTLFTPSEDDLNTLKGERDTLMSWGPLSLPPQIQAVYASTIGTAMQGSSSDPGYWVISLRTVPTFTTNSLPPGDTNPGNANDVASTWPGFFPDSLDLTNFRFFLETGRSICLAVGWVFFVITFVQRVTPEWRV